MIEPTSETRPGVADHLVVAVFALLPVVGLVAGPSYAAFIFALGVVRLAARPRAFRPDWRLAGLAAAFTVLGLTGALWSIVPRLTLTGTAQMAGILVGALVFLGASRAVPAATTRRLAQVMPAAFAVGALLIVADAALGWRLDGWLGLKAVPTKYNRGVIYSLVLAWPLLGFLLATGRRRAALVLAAAVLATVAVGHATTAKLALVLGALTVLAARRAPRLTGRLLAAGTVGLVALLPALLRLVTGERALLIPYIKPSAGHRLEIWNYMSARIVERPLQGWGVWSARFVPITPAELKTYIWADAHGIYPHNQWLQLWLETGVAGVALGLGVTLAALWGVRRLSPALRPFAYGAFVTVMAVAFADFQVTTDSWWALLSAVAFLFGTLDQGVAAGHPAEGVRLLAPSALPAYEADRDAGSRDLADETRPQTSPGDRRRGTSGITSV